MGIHKKKIHVVAALITNRDKFPSVLVAQRAYPLPEWEFPGGKVEERETSKFALQREIEEELGCIVCVGDWIGQSVVEQENRIIEMELFECDISEGIPEAKEHLQLRWLDIKDLYTLEWAIADIPLLPKIQQYFQQESVLQRLIGLGS